MKKRVLLSGMKKRIGILFKETGASTNCVDIVLFPLEYLTGVHTGFHRIGIGRWRWTRHCWYDYLTLATHLYEKRVLYRSIWYICCLNKSFCTLIWVLLHNKL